MTDEQPQIKKSIWKQPDGRPSTIALVLLNLMVMLWITFIFVIIGIFAGFDVDPNWQILLGSLFGTGILGRAGQMVFPHMMGYIAQRREGRTLQEARQRRQVAKQPQTQPPKPTPIKPDPKQKMGNPQPAGIERISPNFTMKEFECHSGAKMPAAVRKKILVLVQQLEVIRAAASNKPITINSGYRSPAHNATVPGASKTSKHMVGMAADFTIAGLTPIQTGKLVEKLMDAGMILPGGIGTYPRTRSRGWVHYDFRGTKTTWRK